MSGSAATTPVTIDHVRVFNGRALGDLTSVTFHDGLITGVGSGTGGATVVDGRGGSLLPGLVDAHVHVEDRAALEALVRHGVTTALDMASAKPSRTDALRGQPGLPDLRGAGIPATAAGGVHTRKMGFPISSVVTDSRDAKRFVEERMSDGSDYIKIIVEDPRMPGTAALPAEVIAAVVTAAHAAGLMTVAHAVTSTAFGLASGAGVDFVTHAPLDRSLTPAEVRSLASRGAALIPTLGMLRGTAAVVGRRRSFRLLRRLRIAPPVTYENAAETVTTAYQGGLCVLAGTDANADAGAPWHPAYGSSLHEELALLVEAGLTPAEAIASATERPAAAFGLTDRGVIAAGRRADLVLVDGDPTTDITSLGCVVGTWVAGTSAS